MFIKKLIFYFIFIVFFSSSVFSLGLYNNNGDFIHYVSNQNPSINISLETPNEPVILESANLIINSNPNILNIGETINLGNKKEYEFNSNDFGVVNISQDDRVFFVLNAKGYDGKKIIPLGDPTEFEIRIDITKPKLYYPQSGDSINLEIKSKNIKFRFNEFIKSYTIKINDNIVKSFLNPSSFERDYFRNFEYLIDLSKLKEGENSLEIFFSDLAGNSNSQKIRLNFRDSNLGVSLITKKEDDNLKYFFDKKFQRFFDKTIYTSDENFLFKIKTTKNAKCYTSNKLLSHRSIYDVGQKVLMNSSDGIIHTTKLSSLNAKIWVACQNPIYSDDIVYLNKELGFDGLINIKRYVGPSVKINSLLPDSYVSFLPFDFYLKTNTKSICKYNVDNQEIYFDSNNYLIHNKSNLNYGEGDKSFNFECFDVLYNIEKISKKIKFDTKNGVKVVDYFPKYTNKQTTQIRLSLSEDTTCKYSSKQESVSNFNVLSDLTGSGVEKFFEASGLSIGDNNFYIYCSKNGEIWSNKINVVYDSMGPILSNLTFVNGDFESDFLGSLKEISFKFGIESLTPIEKYFVNVELSNGSINEIIFSNFATLKNDFYGASKLSIIAQNIAGINSSKLSKPIKFDIEPPVISFNMLGDKMSISCFDLQSGCNEITYGLSKTSIECSSIIPFDKNSTINIIDSNYICAKGIDFARNIGENQKSISLGFTLDENKTSNEKLDNLTFESDIDDEKIDVDPFKPKSFKPETSSSNGVIIVIALVVFLSSIGSSGYYAYKKGYLDDQLKKFGIVRNNVNSTNFDKKTSIINNVKNNVGKISNKLKNNKKEQSTKSYQAHLKDLNKFIDSTINKGGDVFDKFDKVNKGKVKGYNDTLIKKKIGNVSKKDFDDFYSKSSNLNSDSIEDEAEKFEKYYKDKSSSKNSNKKKKK